MKLSLIKACLLLLLFGGVGSGLAQIAFTNLDFESATIIPLQGHPEYPYAVATTNALPGWTVHIGNWPADWILHDNWALDSALVSIHDTNSTYPCFFGSCSDGAVRPVLNGRYSVLLQASWDFRVVP